MKPWTSHIFKCFGKSRVMFGSDWPVCNLNGPTGDDSWSSWREVVGEILNDSDFGFTEAEKTHVWADAAREAYRLS